jgi:hypothetical protein
MTHNTISLSLKIIIQKGNCLYYEKELKANEIEQLTDHAEKWAMEEIAHLDIINSLKDKYYITSLKLLLFLIMAKYIADKEKLNDEVLFHITLLARKCLDNKDKIEIDFNDLFLEH